VVVRIGTSGWSYPHCDTVLSPPGMRVTVEFRHPSPHQVLVCFENQEGNAVRDADTLRGPLQSA
jgi:hypothetical protein